MENLLQWGLDLILAIQKFDNSALDSIFRTITFLGSEEFYILLFPLLVWCLDYRLGVSIGVILLLSSYLNIGLKDLFQQPRPFDLDPSVWGLAEEGLPEYGYGLPSWHSQTAAVVWGSIAAWTHSKWFWRLAVALTALIGFSRVYLGVHFPTDVLIGWAIGAILLVLFLMVQPRIEKRLRELSLGLQVLFVLAVSLTLILVHSTAETIASLTLLAGFGMGAAARSRYVAFSVQVPLWQRTGRFLIGGSVLLMIYLGLKMVLPGEGTAHYLVFRGLRYGLVGVWIGLGAPYLFRLLGLHEDRA